MKRWQVLSLTIALLMSLGMTGLWASNGRGPAAGQEVPVCISTIEKPFGRTLSEVIHNGGGKEFVEDILHDIIFGDLRCG